MDDQIKIQVIGVGSPVVDLVAEVEEEMLSKAIEGRKGGMELVDAETMRTLVGALRSIPARTPGGSAGNTTFALTRMGMPCAFMGKLGNDPEGKFYQGEFKRLGGDCTRFKTDGDAPTALCVSMVTPDSERTMRTHLGAAMAFSPEDVTPEDFAGCSHVHVEGYLLFNRDLLMAVLKAVKGAGCRVSMDLGSFEVVEAARDILPDILSRYVDIVFANEEEAAAFAGSDDPLVGLEELHKICEVAAVKLGRDGALIQNGVESVRVPAAIVPDLIDTTGAGDFWAAGFLYAYLNGYGLSTAGQLGALLASHVIRHLGTSLDGVVWGNIIAETTLLLMEPKEAKKAC